MDLLQQADAVEALLRARQLDGYEIMISHSRDLTVEAKGGKLDAFRAAEPSGVAVRLLKGEGLGFSFSTTFQPERLERMVEGALVAAETQTPDSCNAFPAPAAYPEVSGLYDETLAAVPQEQKVERALELERMVLSIDPRVKRVRKCSYGESEYEVLIRNSRGVCGGYRGSYVSCSVSAVAEEGGSAQIGWDFDFSSRFAALDPEKVARGAARKATSLLGATTLPTMRVPVVLDNHVATGLLEIVAASFVAENVHKGKSLFQGKVGTQVFSELLSVRDNGLLPGGMGTSPCDGEGVPQQDNGLVAKGVLQGYLYDSYWGRKLGHPSTGNAVRGGIKGIPRIGFHNLFIENGETSMESLWEGVPRAVLITEVMGMHTANPISGDFSVGASGFYLENGEMVHPVKGIAISGNLLELFKKVDMVANDLRLFGSVGSPALRISELDVSGT